jgi:hypothetical protein
MIATGVSDPGDDDDDEEELLARVQRQLERAMERMDERMGRPDTYETDPHAWAFEQARRLRAGEPIDAENVAEELESLGRDWERTLDSHLTVLLLHMLKRDFQPGRHTRSWDLSIKEHRRQVNRTLKKMPSLRRMLAEAIADNYPIAVLQASRETHKVEEDFPSKCPYKECEILGGPE